MSSELVDRCSGPANDADAAAHAKELIRRELSALTGRSRGGYDVVVERGLAHLVLARIAISQNALLVVGSHMHHGIGHAFLRDVTERVVERARGPVLVTRPRIASDRILVAVDRPFNTSPAFAVAIEEARSTNSELTVLHCVDTGFIATLAADLVNGGAYAARPLGQHSPISEARHALKAELSTAPDGSRSVCRRGSRPTADPEIAAQVHAELVVVGTAHRPGPPPHVTTSVLHHAPCSVLVADDFDALEFARPPVQTSRV